MLIINNPYNVLCIKKNIEAFMFNVKIAAFYDTWVLITKMKLIRFESVSLL